MSEFLSPGNPKESKLTSEVVSKYNEEKEVYNDFIKADFQDSYRNLTLKTVHMLDWVQSYCSHAKFFMKTDDDVFLNVPAILNFLDLVQVKNLNWPAESQNARQWVSC